MTKDDIIDVAKEAAAKHGHTFKEQPNEAVVDILTEVYAIGAAAEREACAKVVENTSWSNWFQLDCASAIRERIYS